MMPNSPNKTAIVYDFDGTLSPGNIQEHSLIPNFLGTTKEEFWDEVGRRKKTHDADQVLVYMQLLLERAREQGKELTDVVLREHGAATSFFAGVEEWFERINAHAAERGLHGGARREPDRILAVLCL